MPTLEEAFQLIRQRQRKPITIALNMKVISPGIEANIARLVEKYDLFEQLFAFGQPEESSQRFKQANPKLRTTEVKIYDSEHFARALKNRLADCLWVGFIPSRNEMDQARRSGKQVWLSLQIGDKRPDIWGQGPRQPDGRHLHRLAAGMPSSLAAEQDGCARRSIPRPEQIETCPRWWSSRPRVNFCNNQQSTLATGPQCGSVSKQRRVPGGVACWCIAIASVCGRNPSLSRFLRPRSRGPETFHKTTRIFVTIGERLRSKPVFEMETGDCQSRDQV